MFRRSSQELHHPLHLQRKGEEEECFQNAPLGIEKNKLQYRIVSALLIIMARENSQAALRRFGESMFTFVDLV